MGLCYVLEPGLTLPRDMSVGYKSVMVVREAVGGKRLEPKPDFDDHARWGVCQVGTSVAFVEDVGNHQPPSNGTDVEGPPEDVALFGAPGCFTWRGNVLSKNLGTTAPADTALDGSNYLNFSKHGLMGISVLSGRFFRNKELYYVSGAPHAEADTGNTKNNGQVYFFRREASGGGGRAFIPDWSKTLEGWSYGAGFGYALAKMDSNGDGRADLLVGAPFHDGGKSGRGGAAFMYLSNPSSDRFEQSDCIRIVGVGLESQFGIALTSLGDMNGDGFEDVAVGAPYDDGGLGVVYVFLGGPWGLRHLRSTTFADSNAGAKGPSGFYHAEAIADQIISASNLNLNLWGTQIRTFGSSLSGGGMDLDGNGYPDLMVGAYQSGHALLFRARPVIDVDTFVDDRNLQGIKAGSEDASVACPEDPSALEMCFGFRACFRVRHDTKARRSEQGFLNSTLKVRFMVEAEPKKPVSRVLMKVALSSPDQSPEERNKSNVVSGEVLIKTAGNEYYCTDLIGYLAPGVSDLQTPVKFTLSYDLVQDEPRIDYGVPGSPLPNMNHYPILDQGHAHSKFQATFDKDCGPDGVCQSRLTLLGAKLADRLGVELGTAPGDHRLYQLELGTLRNGELMLELQVDNPGEPAYEATLDVFFPDSVSFVGTGDGSPSAAGDPYQPFTLSNLPQVKNETWLQFNLGNPFISRQRPARVLIRFSLSEERLALRNQNHRNQVLTFWATLNTTSSQKHHRDSDQIPTMFLDVGLIMVRRAEVKVSGAAVLVSGTTTGAAAAGAGGAAGQFLEYGGQDQVVGESAIRKLAEVGPQVVHKFLVSNAGPSWVDVMTVRIKWPLQIENGLHRWRQGKWLLYLTDHPLVKNGRGTCALPRGLIANPLNYLSGGARGKGVVARPAEAMETAAKSGPRRSRREQERVVLAKVKQVKTENRDAVEEFKRVVTFDCDQGTAKCIEMVCSLYSVPAGAATHIEVKSRLWNSSLAEDYNIDRVDEVEIFAKASVEVDPDIMQSDLTDDGVAVLVMARPDARNRLLRKGGGYPDWWIIIVSILIGFLLLTIICLTLWKLGFFKRSRRGPHGIYEDYDDTDFMVSAHFEKVALNRDH